jgi:HD-GYP domain-containing protein (c-di-GMP phosphodiesterase class II)
VRRPDGFAHAHRLAAYAEIFARALGATLDEAEKLAQLAALHDIGELALPDSVLFNTGKLTIQEKALKRRHTSFGRELLSATPSLFGIAAATVAYHHHERWDGSGYPDALVGEACPREARIIGILDAYDAVRSAAAAAAAAAANQPAPRDGSADLDDSALVHYFREQRGRHFDPFLVDALLETLADLRVLVPRFPTVQLRAPAP